MMPKFNMSVFSFLLFALFSMCILSACKGQSASIAQSDKEGGNQMDALIIAKEFSGLHEQIAEYILDIFEDKNGNLWFGTLSKGVARYDGKKLIYFDTKDGLSGNAVNSIVEDDKGILWFATHSGLSKYDGKKFTSYNREGGMSYNRMSNILIDRNGTFWIGTWEGVCQFNGTEFSDFLLPNPDIDIPNYQETENWVSEIMEDDQGNIWIGRSGYGVAIYDGKNFTHLTKKDGLPSNCVQEIEQDKAGNIWFGTRVSERDHPEVDKRHGEGGVSLYDMSDNNKENHHFVHFPEIDGFNRNDIYNIYKDTKDNIWIGVNGTGLYRFDGKDFTMFNDIDKPDHNGGFGGNQSMLEDRNGKLWLGLSGGLFRLEGEKIINITVNGPWK